MKFKIIFCFISFLLISLSVNAQELTPEIEGDRIIYNLTISQKMVNITGKSVMAMTINENIPGPTLRFKEGKHAVIKVTNTMDVETSVHWHGLLLPNYMDGVPYLTTPPIRPGETLVYDFPLTHSGTYWYHSHTGLQEQKGIYGSIIVDPETPDYEYDHDLVLVLSDWTNDNPYKVLKNLKRHNEWYGIEIGNAPSILKSIQSGTLKSQLKMWGMKMPGMHISDIPYDAFLINGKEEQVYDDFIPGDKVRLRVINAGASSYFWLNYGGGDLEIISADGINVQPVLTNKVLIGLAETYDFMITVPENKSFELRATPQDVTGYASVFIGNGKRVLANDIPEPDYQKIGIRMAEMHDGSHSHDMSMEGNETGVVTALNKSDMQMDHSKMDHSNHNMSDMEKKVDDHSDHDMMEMEMSDATAPMTMWETGYSNSILKSKESTTINSGDSLRHLTFNLTGNMWRYIWSINGKTLSASDKIKINKGEVVQVTLNNTTMMHHPMHLHGHFFRVLNGNEEYSPLKHTVDVPPMSRITIEFAANEEDDWLFHCHLLYHMSSGMTRVFSYNDDKPRDERLAPYPVNTLYNKDKQWFTWGTLSGASQMSSLELTHSNTYGEFNLITEFDYNENYEARLDYEHFIGDYTRFYGGVKSKNETHDSLNEHEIVGRVGIRYLLWYVLDTDVSVDHLLRPEIELETHLPLTQRLMLTGHFEWKSDFGITEQLPAGEHYEYELTYNPGLEFFINEHFSLKVLYDNRFGWGGGISWRF